MKLEHHDFINFCLEHNVLKFGDFVLKSGRKSHYFFNIGAIYNNSALKKLGEFYAQLIFENIIQNDITLDCIYGPAYKGIPLAIITALALEEKYQYKIDIAFNRKEAKTHGEGGNIIGANVTSKNVLIIDDVISAGTAAKETILILQQKQANIIGMAIALDRQMSANNTKYKSAREEINKEYNLPVYSITSLNEIIQYTKETKRYSAIYKLLSKEEHI